MSLIEKFSQMSDWLLSSFQWMQSATKNNVLQCLSLRERKVHHELWEWFVLILSLLWTQWGRLGSSRVSIVGEETSVLCLFWGHFKVLISAICANGNCLGQRLQTSCKEAAWKNFQCGKYKLGNQPFQAIWWRIEGQKGPHSSLYTLHISVAVNSTKQPECWFTYIKLTCKWISN